MAKKNRKETDPIRYYKGKKRWMEFGSGVCFILPPFGILLTYGIVSVVSPGVNPFNPFTFSLGMGMFILAVFLVLFRFLRGVSAQNKKTGKGPIFGVALAWGYVSLMLGLLWLSMFWLILFTISEAVSTFVSAFFIASAKECDELVNKNKDAELNAEAEIRVQKREKAKASTPIE